MLFAIRSARRALLAELTQALSITPRNSGSLIETHVLLDSTAGFGLVSLQATNHDESLASTFHAQVDGMRQTKCMDDVFAAQEAGVRSAML